MTMTRVRSKIEVFDHILQTVVQMSYPFEVPFYKNTLWERATRIVDMGCGNAEYTAFLKAAYPQKHVIGVEMNSKMAAIAAQRYSDRLEIVNSSYESLPEDFAFGFLLARRFMLPIIHERHQFYSWLRKHALPGAGILLIDTNIDRFHLGEDLKEYASFFQSIVKEQNRETSITELLIDEMTEAGFVLRERHSIPIHTEMPGIKGLLYAYMRLTVELHTGCPIPTELDNELFDWLIKPSAYGQFEIFGLLFELVR